MPKPTHVVLPQYFDVSKAYGAVGVSFSATYLQIDPFRSET